MTPRCRRHSYVWIPRSGATFENQSTGDMVDAEIWAQRVGLEVREA